MKIVVFGPTNAGKSTLIEKLANSIYQIPVDDIYTPTECKQTLITVGNIKIIATELGGAVTSPYQKIIAAGNADFALYCVNSATYNEVKMNEDIDSIMRYACPRRPQIIVVITQGHLKENIELNQKIPMSENQKFLVSVETAIGCLDLLNRITVKQKNEILEQQRADLERCKSDLGRYQKSLGLKKNVAAVARTLGDPNATSDLRTLLFNLEKATPNRNPKGELAQIIHKYKDPGQGGDELRTRGFTC